MQGFSILRIGPALVLGCCLGLAACSLAPAEAPAPAPPAVMVSAPIERDVTDYADFTARTAAVEAVGVRARVWGYLVKVTFTEGALVKKGDVLFEIDPRTYQARWLKPRATWPPWTPGSSGSTRTSDGHSSWWAGR